MKTCNTCGEWKPLAAYSKKPDTRDGLQPVCKSCATAFRKKWAEGKREHLRQVNQRYARHNREHIAEQKRIKYAERQDENVAKARAYRLANPDKVRARSRTYYAKNREQCLATTRKWREQFGKQWEAEARRENPGKHRAKNSKRRAALLQAVPAWANLDKIQEFYDTAEALGMWAGEWHHVDHIVPLLGKTVRGLHCEANLQILTSAENRTKGNRHWPNQP